MVALCLTIWTLSFIVLISLFHETIFEFLLVLLQLFGVHRCTINDPALILKIEKDIFLSTTLVNGKSHSGYFVGRWFLGYRTDCHDKMILIIELTQLQKFEKKVNYCASYIGIPLEDSESEEDDYEDNNLHLLDIAGQSITKQYVLPRKVRAQEITPSNVQAAICDSIYNTFLLQNNVVVVLHGPSGVGKFTIAMLLAQKLNGTLVPEVGLTSAGSPHFNEIIGNVKQFPAVVMIEEADQLIQTIWADKVQKHQEAMTQVSTKSDWNRFWKKVAGGFFPGCIFILSMNSDVKEIDALDSSMLRGERVDFKIHLEHEKVRICDGWGKMLEEVTLDESDEDEYNLFINRKMMCV